MFGGHCRQGGFEGYPLSFVRSLLEVNEGQGAGQIEFR
jgi:hypothetical protein